VTKTKGAAIGAAVLIWGVSACGLAPPAPLPATKPLETAAAPSRGALAPVEMAPSRASLPSLALAAPGPRSAPPIGGLPGPDSLIGLSSDAVTAVLGPPQFRRREAPAEIWRYRTKICFLDLFLYRDGAALKVTHFEVRGPDVATIGDKDCYLGLLAERSRAKAL
jgi:hypothetical protein